MTYDEFNDSDECDRCGCDRCGENCPCEDDACVTCGCGEERCATCDCQCEGCVCEDGLCSTCGCDDTNRTSLDEDEAAAAAESGFDNSDDGGEVCFYCECEACAGSYCGCQESGCSVCGCGDEYDEDGEDGEGDEAGVIPPITDPEYGRVFDSLREIRPDAKDAAIHADVRDHFREHAAEKVSPESLPAGEISEDGTCPRHGGPWGEDMTCSHCTTEDGDPKPTRWDAPGSTKDLIFEDERGRFYQRNADGTTGFKRTATSPWDSSGSVGIPSTATPVTAARASELGRESGRCLACNRSLSSNSASTGYGPKCRSKFA